MKNTGVYTIKNKINGKCYVGSTTKSFKERWRKHLSSLRLGKHHTRHLQSSFNKYGEQAFEFKVLQETNPEEARELEQKLLDKGMGDYNYSTCATGGLPFKFSDDEVVEILKLHATGKHTSLSLAKKFDCSDGTILRVVSGKAYSDVPAPKPLREKCKKILAARKFGGNKMFTDQQVIEILELYARGRHSMNNLANEFGCSYPAIRNLIKGITYKNVQVSNSLKRKCKKVLKKNGSARKPYKLLKELT